MTLMTRSCHRPTRSILNVTRHLGLSALYCKLHISRYHGTLHGANISHQPWIRTTMHGSSIPAMIMVRTISAVPSRRLIKFPQRTGFDPQYYSRYLHKKTSSNSLSFSFSVAMLWGLSTTARPVTPNCWTKSNRLTFSDSTDRICHVYARSYANHYRP